MGGGWVCCWSRSMKSSSSMGSEVVDRSESSSEMESERRVRGVEGGLELERERRE